MNRLPTELFASIMTHLPMMDKLNCNLVCKDWHDRLINGELYSKLIFQGDEEKLYEAIHFFKKLKNFGKHTRKLLLYKFSMEDPNLTVALMSLFPNVRIVLWKDIIGRIPPRSKHDNDAVSSLCDVWTRLEKLTISSVMFYANPLLTKPAQYIYLKYLDVNVIFLSDLGHSEAEARRRSNRIISQLCNAPNLETFIFRNTFLSLIDLERLHKISPNLKHIELNYTNLAPSGPLEVISPAMDLLTFHLCIANIPRLYSLISVETKCRWLAYFGSKYKNVQDFSVSYSNPVDRINMPILEGVSSRIPLEDRHLLLENGSFKNPVHRSVVDSLLGMKNISSYRNVLCSDIARHVLNVLDTNNVALRTIHLDIVQSELLTPFWYFKYRKARIMSLLEPNILSHQQSKSITEVTFTLGVESVHEYMHHTLIEGIIDFTNALKNLVHLTLQNFHKENWNFRSFFFVIQNVLTLEQLTVDGMFMDKDIPTDFQTQINKNAYGSVDEKTMKSSLKMLTLENVHFQASNRIVRIMINLFLQDTLKICSDLNTFSISGTITDERFSVPGIAGSFNHEGDFVGDYLNLSFIECTQLKSLTVDFEGFHYYIFNGSPEKRGIYWHDYHHQAVAKDVSRIKIPRFINLAWIGKLETLNLSYLSPFISTDVISF